MALREIGYRSASDVRGREVTGEGILLDMSSGHYFALNKTGWLIWSMLTSGASVSEAARAVAARFAASPARIERDTARFAERLVRVGVLVEGHAADDDRR